MKLPERRSQLEWSLFEQKDGKNWFFAVKPEYYTQLFNHLCPELLPKFTFEWRKSSTGKSYFTYLRDLDDDDIEKVQSFLADYKNLVLIGLNKNIKDHFTDELDYCIALDFNRNKPEDENRTEAGTLEYEAKYKKSEKSIEKLADLFYVYIKRIPGLNFADDISICYVPAERGKEFHLPKILAEKLSSRLRQEYSDSDAFSIVNAVLLLEKPSLKDLRLEEKLRIVKLLFNEKNIAWEKHVKGKTIILIDDLYQSGLTLWTCAGSLKKLGAKKVFGLVCVKALSDKG